MVNGKRLIQSATDIFVGWTSFDDMDFYVRQFRDMKVIPDVERIAPVLGSSRPRAARCSPGHTPERVTP